MKVQTFALTFLIKIYNGLLLSSHRELIYIVEVCREDIKHAYAGMKMRNYAEYHAEIHYMAV